ncbi:hypothetical protein BGZ70_005866, partial [Mortierella alpina]
PSAAAPSDSKTLAHQSGTDTRMPWRKLVFAGWNCFNQRLDPMFCESNRFEAIRALHVEHLTPGLFDLSCVLSELPAMEELVLEAFMSTPYSEGRNALVAWTDREQQLRQHSESTIVCEAPKPGADTDNGGQDHAADPPRGDSGPQIP